VSNSLLKRGLIVRIQVDYSHAGNLLRYSLSLIDLSSSLDKGELWAMTTPTDSITGTILDAWIVWSLNPMKSLKVSLKRKSAGGGCHRTEGIIGEGGGYYRHRGRAEYGAPVVTFESVRHGDSYLN
jgi:hypothetical protein